MDAITATKSNLRASQNTPFYSLGGVLKKPELYPVFPNDVRRVALHKKMSHEKG